MKRHGRHAGRPEIRVKNQWQCHRQPKNDRNLLMSSRRCQLRGRSRALQPQWNFGRCLYNQIMFTNILVSGTPSTGYQFGFGSRTGGNTENHFIDNLNITTVTIGKFYVRWHAAIVAFGGGARCHGSGVLERFWREPC